MEFILSDYWVTIYSRANDNLDMIRVTAFDDKGACEIAKTYINKFSGKFPHGAYPLRLVTEKQHK